MTLQDIFSEEMQNLKDRMETVGNKFPNLMRAFSLKKNDPHIEKMISSFALISASLEYEVAKKIAKEIQSIFVNVFPNEFTTIPPTGMIQITPSKGEHFQLQKGQVFRSGNNIFKVKRDFFINDLKIDSFDKVFYNDKLSLKIILTGNNLLKIQNIDLCLDLKTINSIFRSENLIQGLLKNRDVYDTSFDIKLHNIPSIKEFFSYQSQSCFVRLSNFQLHKNINSELEIYIPLKENVNLENVSIKINTAIVENKFTVQSSAFRLKNGQECDIPSETNIEIISVKKVFKLTGEEIKHVNQDSNGWHVLIKSNNKFPSIYIDSIMDEDVFVEMECFNKSNNYEQIFFDEYIPGNIDWADYPSEALQFVLQNEITKLIQLMYLDNNSMQNSLQNVGDLIQIYDKTLKIKFENIETYEIIKPVRLSNYVIPKIHLLLTASVNTSNFLLLRHIVQEIQNKVNTKIDFSFQTNLGEVNFEP